MVGSPSGHRHTPSRSSMIVTPSDKGTTASFRSGNAAGWGAYFGHIIGAGDGSFCAGGSTVSDGRRGLGLRSAARLARLPRREPSET